MSMSRRENPRFTISVRRAFTLIEVLVVVAIIALLVAILIPSLSQARELAYRAGCAANLHSIGHAMTFYSQDFKDYYFYNGAYNFTTGAWAQSSIGGDSCVALAVDMKSFPTRTPGNTAVGAPSKRYIRTWDNVLCPATKNKVRYANDLNNNVDSRLNGPGDGFYGHSYEWWNGFQLNNYAGPGPVNGKAYAPTDSDTNNDGFPDCLKRPSICEKRAAYIILVLDGDDPRTASFSDINNWPDSPDDNHGSKGWNIIFADMHARWVTKYQTYSVLKRSDMTYSHVPPEYIPKGSGGWGG
ncbi:MAG: hypothetical protein AMXMBFR83_28400 [Phycisphaerae bacterium]